MCGRWAGDEGLGVCQGAYVEVRGQRQFTGIGSLFPLCDCQGSKLAHSPGLVATDGTLLAPEDTDLKCLCKMLHLAGSIQ